MIHCCSRAAFAPAVGVALVSLLGAGSVGNDDARSYHERLIREVVRMLCVGVVHGD